MSPRRTAGLAQKKRVFQVWEVRQNQNNLKINILRKNAYGSPEMKHMKHTVRTIKVSSISPLLVDRRL